jgi:hypothetical protein
MQISQAIDGNRRSTHVDLRGRDVWCEVCFRDLYSPIVKWLPALPEGYSVQGLLEASF